MYLMEYIVESEQITYEKMDSGVEKHIRYSEDYAYIFYLNNSNIEANLKNLDGINLITGEKTDEFITLLPRECLIVKR